MDDANFFAENRDARFLLRPWRMSDDRHASGSPKLGVHYTNLRDMEGITIVYRAGCRDARFYTEGHFQSWQCAKSDAQCFLKYYPELGVDGPCSPNGETS